MKDKFYAVVDDEGIVSINHDKYEGIKAIFDNYEDAKNALLRNPEEPIRIVEVAVIDF